MPFIYVTELFLLLFQLNGCYSFSYLLLVFGSFPMWSNRPPIFIDIVLTQEFKWTLYVVWSIPAKPLRYYDFSCRA